MHARLERQHYRGRDSRRRNDLVHRLRSSRARFLGLFAIAVVASSFLLSLGALDFIDPDESRHAEIARVMRVSGQYLTPSLHGTPYYDKPALFHWAINLASAVVGPGPLATRLPSALGSIVSVMAMALWAWRVYSPLVGILTALGMATTVGFVAIGRFAVVDGLLTALLTLAFLKLGSWFLDTPYDKRSLRGFWILLGLATLAKGPVVFLLAALVVTLLALAEPDRSVLRLLRESRPLRGVLLAVAVAVPWYVSAWLSDPAYIETFLWHHNLERYLGAADFRHQAPFYYYLFALPLGLLPWTPLIVVAVARYLRPAQRRRSDLFLGAWALAVIGFYQGAGTKLLTYILPAFAPLICLGAVFVADCLEGRQSLPKFFRYWAAAFTLLVAIVIAALPFAALTELGVTSAELCLGLVFGPLLAAASAWSLRRGNDGTVLLTTTATVCIFLFMVYGPTARQLRPLLSMKPGAAVVVEKLPEAAEFIAVLAAPHAISFYSGHPAARFNDTEAALERFNTKPGSILFTKSKYLDRLGFDPLPEGVAIIWSGGHERVLLQAVDATREGTGDDR